jgi:hypothetical protein
MGGLLQGCTDSEPEVRVAAIRGDYKHISHQQLALRQMKHPNPQIRETLYYLLHYDSIELVQEQVTL